MPNDDFERILVIPAQHDAQPGQRDARAFDRTHTPTDSTHARESFKRKHKQSSTLLRDLRVATVSAILVLAVLAIGASSLSHLKASTILQVVPLLAPDDDPSIADDASRAKEVPGLVVHANQSEPTNSPADRASASRDDKSRTILRASAVTTLPTDGLTPLGVPDDQVAAALPLKPISKIKSPVNDPEIKRINHVADSDDLDMPPPPLNLSANKQATEMKPVAKEKSAETTGTKAMKKELVAASDPKKPTSAAVKKGLPPLDDEPASDLSAPPAPFKPISPLLGKTNGQTDSEESKPTATLVDPNSKANAKSGDVSKLDIKVPPPDATADGALTGTSAKTASKSASSADNAPPKAPVIASAPNRPTVPMSFDDDLAMPPPAPSKLDLGGKSAVSPPVASVKPAIGDKKDTLATNAKSVVPAVGSADELASKPVVAVKNDGGVDTPANGSKANVPGKVDAPADSLVGKLDVSIQSKPANPVSIPPIIVNPLDAASNKKQADPSKPTDGTMPKPADQSKDILADNKPETKPAAKTSQAGTKEPIVSVDRAALEKELARSSQLAPSVKPIKPLLSGAIMPMTSNQPAQVDVVDDGKKPTTTTPLEEPTRSAKQNPSASVASKPTEPTNPLVTSEPKSAPRSSGRKSIPSPLDWNTQSSDPARNGNTGPVQPGNSAGDVARQEIMVPARTAHVKGEAGNPAPPTNVSNNSAGAANTPMDVVIEDPDRSNLPAHSQPDLHLQARTGEVRESQPVETPNFDVIPRKVAASSKPGKRTVAPRNSTAIAATPTPAKPPAPVVPKNEFRTIDNDSGESFVQARVIPSAPSDPRVPEVASTANADVVKTSVSSYRTQPTVTPDSPSVRASESTSAKPAQERDVLVASYDVQAWIVIAGDTFDSIAQVSYGTSKLGPALASYNGADFASNEPLRNGARIKIPPKRVLDPNNQSTLERSEANKPIVNADVQAASAKRTVSNVALAAGAVKQNDGDVTPLPAMSSEALKQAKIAAQSKPMANEEPTRRVPNSPAGGSAPNPTATATATGTSLNSEPTRSVPNAGSPQDKLTPNSPNSNPGSDAPPTRMSIPVPPQSTGNGNDLKPLDGKSDAGSTLSSPGRSGLNLPGGGLGNTNGQAGSGLTGGANPSAGTGTGTVFQPIKQPLTDGNPSGANLSMPGKSLSSTPGDLPNRAAPTVTPAPVGPVEIDSQVNANSPYESYKVEKQATLWMIAKQKFGDGSKAQEIYELNKDTLLHRDDEVPIGVVLRIPKQKAKLLP